MRNLTIRLDADAARCLDEATGDARGASAAYVRSLLTQAAADWREALSCLWAQGWGPDHLLAGVAALNGVWLRPLLGRSVGPDLALELADAVRLGDIEAPDGWQERLDALAGDDDQGRALAVVAAEWWRGNQALDEAIRREVTS